MRISFIGPSDVAVSAEPRRSEPSSARAKTGPRRHLGWVLFGAVWLALVAYGLRERFLHATTAGVSESAPEVFPVGSKLPRAPGRGAVYMFVHPECPCTRASLQELAELMLTRPERASVVLVVAPAFRAERAWQDTDAAAIARTISGVSVFADTDGAEAARFGAKTSGHVAFYDAAAKLRFSGGITGSRGHVGDNVGLQTLRRLIDHSAASTEQHAVYGCPLDADDEPEQRP